MAMTEMMSFSRRHNESINDVLSRYEVVRARARDEGMFVTPIEGCALQLLRACGVSTQQFFHLLHPFGNRLPTTEAEFRDMTNMMRRMGRILEHAPGNIATTLGNRSRGGNHYAQAFLATSSQATDEFGQSPGWGGHNTQGTPWQDLGNEASMWQQVQPDAQNDQSNTYMSWNSWSGVSDTSIGDSWSGGAQQGGAAPWDGGAQQGGSVPEPTHSFWQSYPYEEPWPGTATDTSSDSGQEEIDMSDVLSMNDAEASEHVFLQYRRAKRRWRRMTQKPVRRFRRLDRRLSKGKGKGKAFGKGKPSFLSSTEGHVYLKGKGKGKRFHTSGKGFGRRKNPRGRDGQVMRCRICNSDEHFAAKCPRAGAQQGGGGGSSSSGPGPHMFAQTQEHSSGPLADLLRDIPDSDERSYRHVFMASSGTDPLFQNDPWAALEQAHRIPVPADTPQPPQTRPWWERSPAQSQGSMENYASTSSAAPAIAPETLTQLRQALNAPNPSAHTSAPNNAAVASDRQLTSILMGSALTSDYRARRREQRGMSSTPAVSTIVPQAVLNISQLRTMGRVESGPPQFASLFSGGASSSGIPRDSNGRPTGGGAQQGGTASVVHTGGGAQQGGTASVAVGNDAQPATTFTQTLNETYAEAVPVIYDGNNDTCSICIQEFQAGQRVVRIRCRHIFHGECWTQVTTRMEHLGQAYPQCPNCRGSGQIIAIWNYVDDTYLTQPGAPNLLTVAQPAAEHELITPRSMATEYHFGTPDSHASVAMSESPWIYDHSRNLIVLPSTYLDASDWTPVGERSDSTPNDVVSYHTDTRLRDGRPAILIDPGSVGNLGGDRWARDCSRAAVRAGRRPVEIRRSRPLSVTGVGHGSQSCTHNCRIPVMLRTVQGTSNEGTFEAPIVPNSELPGLLGLHSMRNARALLDMSTLQLHLCGPGNVQYNLPPGSDTYQLEIAPSGHLVLPCGEFEAPRIPHNSEDAQELALAVQTPA